MCAPTFGSISLPREMLSALDCTYWLEQMKHVQDIVAVLSLTQEKLSSKTGCTGLKVPTETTTDFHGLGLEWTIDNTNGL